MPVVTRSGQRGGTPVALGLVSALVVATSLAAVVSRQWTPVNDQAILWLNANDVGTADTPLTGLYSRFGWDHPGPMAFYLLALPLRLFGGRPSALLVGAVLLGLVAIVLAVWSAYRAGSLGAAIPVALVVSILVVALGDGLIDPWTPWLVVLPLVAFFCVLWAWLGGNRVMAPIAAGLGTFMVQTHVGLVVPVALIGVAALAWRVLDRSGSRPQWRRPPWVTFVVLTVLWIPPLAQQVFTRPGNLGDLLAHFSGASGEVTPGLAMGLRLAATSLSPVGPWVGRDAPGFLGGISPAPTWWLVFPVALLVVSVMLAWRWQDMVGLRLVGLVAAGQVATVVALTRVEGIPYPYLIWWSRGVVALTVAAPLVVLGRRIGARVGTEPSRLPIVGLVACVVTVFAVLAVFRESPLSGPSSRYRALVAGVPSVLPEATVVRVDSQGGGAFDYSPATLVIALKEQGLRALLAPVRSVSGAPSSLLARTTRRDPMRCCRPSSSRVVGRWTRFCRARAPESCRRSIRSARMNEPRPVS